MEAPRFVGFDIESTHLKAPFARVLCTCFVPMIGDSDEVVTFAIDEYKGNGVAAREKKLLKDVKDYLEGSWCWLGWYSKHFDIPLLNGRLALHGIAPIERRLHIDAYYFSKHVMALHSGRLDSVAQTFAVKSQKTNLLPSVWQKAGEGNPEALHYIVEHCKEDVKILRDIFPILAPFIRNVHY